MSTEIEPAQRPKTHHKVPRFYLEGFRDPMSGTGKKARIWVYSKDEGQPRRCNPAKTGFETDFYALIGPDGHRDARLESWLANNIDTPAHLVWPRICDPEMPLSEDDRNTVLYFVAMLFSRTSSVRSAVMRVVQQLREDVERTKYHPVQLDALEIAAQEAVRQQIRKASGDSPISASVEDVLQTGHNDLVRLVGVGVDRLAALLWPMSWCVFHAPDGSHFITSDNPVARVNPYTDNEFRRADLTQSGIEVSFPLTRSCCSLMSHHFPERHVVVDAHVVEILNDRTLMWATKEVYTSQPDTQLDDILSPGAPGNIPRA